MPHCPGFDQWTALRQAEWNQAANGGKKSAGFNLRAPNTQPQLAHCPFYPTSHLRLGGNSRVTLSFSVESCDCCLSGKKYIIIYLLSKRCELHWATPLLFLDYLTFKCVFCTSVHLCLFTSRSPPNQPCIWPSWCFLSHLTGLSCHRAWRVDCHTVATNDTQVSAAHRLGIHDKYTLNGDFSKSAILANLIRRWQPHEILNESPNSSLIWIKYVG